MYDTVETRYSSSRYNYRRVDTIVTSRPRSSRRLSVIVDVDRPSSRHRSRSRSYECYEPAEREPAPRYEYDYEYYTPQYIEPYTPTYEVYTPKYDRYRVRTRSTTRYY